MTVRPNIVRSRYFIESSQKIKFTYIFISKIVQVGRASNAVVIVYFAVIIILRKPDKEQNVGKS